MDIHRVSVTLPVTLSASESLFARTECMKTELRNYWKCSLFDDERETARANFEELKPASHVAILGTILNLFDVFVAVFFSLLNSLNLGLIISRYLFFCVYDYVYLFCLCFSPVALSLNFTHHDVFFFVQYCLFTINLN